MGLFSSGKSSSDSVQQYTPNIPSWITQAYQTNTQNGINAANKPFNFTSSDVIQPFSDDQLNAFNQVRQNQGQYQNVFDTALGTQNQIIQQGLNGPSANQINSLMNPYINSVVDQTRQGATRQADIERNQINQSSANAGAFGGSRQAVQNRELNQDLQTQLNGIQYQGLADAYNNAQTQYNTGINQAANAANSSVANATSANNVNNQDINNLLTTGGQQQQLGQQAKNFDFYKNYQQPLDAANYTQSLLGQVPLSMYGYTNSTNTSSTPASGSLLGQLAGGIVGAAGLGLPGGGTVGGSLFSSLGGLFGAGAGAGAATAGAGAAAEGAGAAFGAGGLADLAPLLFLNGGGLVKGYASGGLVTDDDASGLSIPGANIPNGLNGLPFQGSHNILNAILSPKEQAIFGTGNNSGFKQPIPGNVMNNILPPPAVLNNQGSSGGQSVSSPASSAPLSPLDLVTQSAGKSLPSSLTDTSDSATKKKNDEDPLNQIVKNSNYPLLAMGLSLLGSDKSFAQALGDSGLKGIEVALAQQKQEGEDATKQKELAAKYLDLQQQAAKSQQIDSAKAAARQVTERGQDLQRQSAAERNAAYKQKTNAAAGLSPTKLLIQATKDIDGRINNDVRLQGKINKDPSVRQNLIDDQFKQYMATEQKKADDQNELGEQVQDLKDTADTQNSLAEGDADESDNSPAITKESVAAAFKAGKITRDEAVKALQALGGE